MDNYLGENRIGLRLKSFLFSFFILGSIVCAAAAPMSVKDFTKMYRAYLSSTYPEVKCMPVNDSTINAEFKGGTTIISVDNMYKEYLMQPNEVISIFKRYGNVAAKIFRPAPKIDILNVLPVIKPVAFLTGIQEEAKKLGDTTKFNMVYEKYNDQLLVFYVEDTKDHVNYLMQADLKELSLNRDSLPVLAKSNLQRLIVPAIEKNGGRGLFMLSAGGTYESSLILLNSLFTKDYLPVDGDFVVFIPNRDLFLITGSNDEPGLAKATQMTKDFFATGDHPVSPFSFKWNGKIFEKF